MYFLSAAKATTISENMNFPNMKMKFKIAEFPNM